MKAGTVNLLKLTFYQNVNYKISLTLNTHRITTSETYRMETDLNKKTAGKGIIFDFNRTFKRNISP